MSQQNEGQQERIETHHDRRFKLRGTQPIAYEETCLYCHELYWQSIVIEGTNDLAPYGHTCQPPIVIIGQPKITSRRAR